MAVTQKFLRELLEIPGVYLFRDTGNTLLYVGKARNLKKRVTSYFRKDLKDAKTRKLISLIARIETIPVSSEFEALLLEAKLIKKNQPKYNVIWKDDKHYIYIKLTREQFPKVLFARKTDSQGYFYGPFPGTRIVKEILTYIRTIFPYCTQKETASRACFYSHLGLCNPCPAEIARQKGQMYQILHRRYRQNIASIRKILEGKIFHVKKLLTSQMKKFSEDKNYEEAAFCRDKLANLEYLVNHYTPASSYMENPKFLSQLRRLEQEELTALLKPYFPVLAQIRHIECFDISNISGKLATGSMVTFVGGHPDKNLYRRFRIRRKDSPDDFAMLSEMLSRRLSHPEWKLPDLFVIDGGKPQLMALTKVLADLKVNIPTVGLAKEFEEIVVPLADSYVKIALPQNSKALNLVKRLRDEAHRFAHAYHSLLRLKYLLSSG